jgi:hypothetical protein
MGICAPDEDKLYMAAYMEAHYEIKAVEDFITEKEIEKQRNSTSGR